MSKNRKLETETETRNFKTETETENRSLETDIGVETSTSLAETVQFVHVKHQTSLGYTVTGGSADTVHVVCTLQIQVLVSDTPKLWSTLSLVIG